MNLIKYFLLISAFIFTGNTVCMFGFGDALGKEYVTKKNPYNRTQTTLILEKHNKPSETINPVTSSTTIPAAQQTHTNSVYNNHMRILTAPTVPVDVEFYSSFLSSMQEPKDRLNKSAPVIMTKK